LEGAHDQQPLLKFIDEAMVVADRKRVLEVQCMLCTLYVMYTVRYIVRYVHCMLCC